MLVMLGAIGCDVGWPNYMVNLFIGGAPMKNIFAL